MTFNGEAPLVSVIIPAYQAEATLAETLASVAGQTYRNLEVIVVDDGSRDSTADIAASFAKNDHRIRMVRQANGGVARARNRGISEASGEYLAFVDADDLWRPDKIERQLRVMIAGGEQLGLVYTWSALIDEQSLIIGSDPRETQTGDVLHRLLGGNFIGNGSCALVRRHHVEAIGGFDPALHDDQAQGCEDWKAYLLLAERCLFGVVPDQLTGYRQSRRAMSCDLPQMLRSDAQVRQIMVSRHPNVRENIEAGRRWYLDWLLYREQMWGNWSNVRFLLDEMRKISTARFGTARHLRRLGRARLKTTLVRERPFVPTTPFLASTPVGP